MPLIGGVLVPDPPKRFVLKRPPQTDEELWWLVRAMWGRTIPRQQVCPGHVAPFTAFANAYFARHPIQIWKASRGFGGKTRMLGLLGNTEMVALGAEVNVLGGSGAQSLNVQHTSQEAWAHFGAPKGLLTGPPTKFDTDLSNGGHMRSLMASQTSVRGSHPQRLRLDEIDEMELAILEASQGQPMRGWNQWGMIETNTVYSSTHQYPDKTMTEMLKRARERGWPIYEWCWRETSNPIDGWLMPDEVARKRQEIPQHMWETEYDLQEPSIEGRAIDTDAVERMFDASFGTFSGKQRITSDPTSGSQYITGVDWAKKQDMTVIGTYRINELPWVCVAWQQMNHKPWPYMIGEAVKQWLKFGGKFVHDGTGIGDVVDDIIKETVPSGMRSQVKTVIMSAGRERSSMFADYVAAIENDDIRSPRIEYAYDEHRYVTVDDLYGTGHPPDSVVSGALAWSQRRHKLVIGLPQGGIRPVSPWTSA